MARSDNSRPGAVLTRQQRDYLQGNVDKSGDADRAFRYKIRQRLRAAMHDLALIYNCLSTDELRTTFGDDHRPEQPEDEPIPGYAPRDNYGRIGHGYEDELGIPREGDLGSGFPGGKSVIEAGLEHFIESNPKRSKANPPMQRSLRDSAAYLCRAATAAQIKPDRVLEDGYNAYLQDHQRADRVAYVKQYSENAAYREAREIIRDPEKMSLNRAHRTAIKRRGKTIEELAERFDSS